MIFYKIDTNFQPKFEFAFSVSSDRYENIIDKRKNIIEIMLNMGDTLSIKLDGRTIFVPFGYIFVSFPDMYLQCSIPFPGKLKTQNVAMYLSHLKYEKYSEADCELIGNIISEAGKDHWFMPVVMDVSSNIQYISSLFNLIISRSMRHDAIGDLFTISEWYSLIAHLSDVFQISVLQNRGLNKRPLQYYSFKAKKIIDSQFQSGISVKEIAASLKITPNYLSAVFKKECNITICDYINRLRVEKARALLREKRYTVSKIAEIVGLGDSRYLQRLFKNYYGVCMRDCSLVDNELSLYFKKPWETDNLQGDIYIPTNNESDTVPEITGSTNSPETENQ